VILYSLVLHSIDFSLAGWTHIGYSGSLEDSLLGLVIAGGEVVGEIFVVLAFSWPWSCWLVHLESLDYVIFGEEVEEDGKILRCER